MPCIEVRHLSSMRMNGPSISRSIASRPQPSVAGLRPTVTRILSTASVTTLPSAASMERASRLDASPFALAPVSTPMSSSRRRSATGRGTYFGKCGPQLQPDIASAHDDKLTRHFGQRQGPCRRDHLAAERKERKFDNVGTRGNHHLFRADHLLADFRLHLDRLAVAKSRPALDDLHFRPLQQSRNSVVKATDDALLPEHGLREIERGLAGGNAERTRAARDPFNLLKLFGCVDQGL